MARKLQTRFFWNRLSMGVSLATRGIIGFLGKLLHGSGIGSGEAFGTGDVLPMFFAIPTQQIPLTVNGTSNGKVTVDLSYLETLVVGVTGFIGGNTGLPQEFVITKIRGDGGLWLRFSSSAPNNYGYSDCSSYTVLDNANLSVVKQKVLNERLTNRFQNYRAG